MIHSGMIHSKRGRHARPLPPARESSGIEGVMFFDVEREHELRFGPHYRPVAGLDPARMNLYRLAQYLSLVEGPLRLLDGDFPHRDAMRDIAEQNIERTLLC
ncbi:hypothetical protein C8D87_104284 [Lentzea atacamensis]|uniref:Uncharacterized protein n=1 Tax=Lentzea atacamensis TaxID=531938 RepID=A0ABX9E9I6_9PSEU|nr:hypothetical protein [Lentzea atacamensis]RAS65733.1 hypothetical protein C8D87_104284 [Lentzea atacamensis]